MLSNEQHSFFAISASANRRFDAWGFYLQIQILFIQKVSTNADNICECRYFHLQKYP